MVKPVIESFISNGNFEEATLGIQVYDESVAQYLDLKSKLNSGIYVANVNNRGASYNSGLTVGDIITYIDDQKLETINDLKEYIYSKKPGDTVVLKVTRGSRSLEFEITLGKK